MCDEVVQATRVAALSDNLTLCGRRRMSGHKGHVGSTAEPILDSTDTAEFSQSPCPSVESTQFYSRRFPHLCERGRPVSGKCPGFHRSREGCHVWDLDGNEFIEYGMGLRAVTLGHAFDPVVEAAYEQMKLGTNFTRPAKIEVDLPKRCLNLSTEPTW